MFEFSIDYEFQATGDERPNVVVPNHAPHCKLAIRRETGDWYVATGVYFKPVESLDGTTFRDIDGGIWQLLSLTPNPSPETQMRGLSEDQK